MTTAHIVTEPTSGPTEKPGALPRALFVILGLAAVVVGVVLLANPVGAATSLAWLVALALVVGGVLEMAWSWQGGRRWLGVLLGAVLVIGGVVAISWPGITLWALAVVAGVDLLVHGVARVVVAIAGRAEFAGWGWTLLAGVLNIAVGVAALVWPAATVLVLALLLGAQVVVFGVLMMVAGLRRGDGSATRPAVAA